MNVNQLSAAAALFSNRLRPSRLTRHLAAVSTAVLLGALLMVTSACSPASTQKGDNSTLKIAINSAPNSLNPAMAQGSRQFIAIPLSLSYAALFHQTPDGKIEPQLATSWEYDRAQAKTRNQVFTFTLRSGAKFSDGTPVTAESVVGWLTYFVKSKGLFVGSFGADPKFTATGPLDVKIEMTSPNPNLPFFLSDQGDNAGFIASPKAVANPKLMDSKSYGAGQYQQTSESVSGDHYTYEPNPYYYDKPAIRFKQVYVKVISNASSRLQAQQSGQYQVSLGDATTAKAAKAAGVKVKTAPQGMFFLSLDLTHDVGAPALRNVKVRQAMNYAINRVAIAKALFGDYGVPRWGFVTADDKSKSADFHYDFDVAKAKQLLAEAGYAKGFSLNLLCSGYFGNFGEPLMNAVAQNLKAVRIDVKITCAPDQASFVPKALSYKNALVQTLNQFDVTPVTYPLYLAASSPIAFYGGDKEIDRLYALGASSSDPSKYWDQMWQRFTSQAYTVPLVDLPNFFFVSKGISGVDVNSDHNTSLPTSWYPTGK